WYNGYNFLGDNVYNPFDILLFIRNEFLYKNYWFETGTPTFLLQLLKQGNYFIPRLENLSADADFINGFDITKLALEPILFQSGYLTIKKVEENAFGSLEYQLKVPNKEVAMALNTLIIEYLSDNRNPLQTRTALFSALHDVQLDAFKETLVSLFAAIPYNNYVNNTIAHFEGYYASVLYAYIASVGIEIIAEDVTNKGRIDLTLKMEKVIYILEFKVGSENALAQIKQRNYQQKYITDSRDIYLMGINFDEDKKNIELFEWERVG
ncbi:MAG: PD-(D/E)XK nuclease domain-containing protein, partial [Methyloprofundus sp.]|nr:PD-(D/E)XK nuclease domain-containing protein [Methyloprofundus sp.]